MRMCCFNSVTLTVAERTPRDLSSRGANSLNRSLSEPSFGLRIHYAISLKLIAVGSGYSSFGEFKEEFEASTFQKHITIKVEKSDKQRYVAC
jgi:hypothetical protein